MSAATSLLPTTIKTASKFLQTAVLIDDRAYETDAVVQAAGGLTKPGRSVEPVTGPVLTQDEGPGDPTRSVTDLHRLDVRNVVQGFAKGGIVCSVIRPEKDDDLNDESGLTRKLSTVTDILIVDWSLFKDKGDRAVGLLGNVVQAAASGTPEQLRLLVVYTAEADLKAISKRIREKLNELGISDIVTEDDELTILAGIIRIVILAKDGIVETQTYFPQRVVRFENLAERTINEFALMTTGLVSLVALNSLTELRCNTGRLLAVLSKVDASYLTHRALTLHPMEAEEHLIDLIGSEIISILGQTQPSKLINEDTIRSWFSDVLARSGAVKPKTGDIDPVTALTSLCTLGLTSENGAMFRNASWVDAINKRKELKVSQIKEIASTIACKADDTQNDQNLAMLMSLRTFYGTDLRTLSLGVVVATVEADKRRYWMCLQPKCDSLRITIPRAFPLLELRIVANEGDKFNFVVNGLEKKPLLLAIDFKPFKCIMVTFKPEAKDNNTVTAKKTDDGLAFISTDGHKYFWVAELKTEHAQRVANNFGGQIARVGLTESEWLRRMS